MDDKKNKNGISLPVASVFAVQGHSPFSYGIRQYQRRFQGIQNDYTHVGVCIGPSSDEMIEAAVLWVRQRPLSIYAHPKYNLRVYAPKKESSLIRCQVVAFCSGAKGKIYGINDIAAFLLPWLPTGPSLVVCTELVARAWFFIGVDICPGVDFGKITPGAMVEYFETATFWRRVI